jgi:hypothetical protein
MRRRGHALRRRYGRSKTRIIPYRDYSIRIHGAGPGEHIATIYDPYGAVAGARSASTAHGASIQAAMFIDDVLEPR